MGKLNSLIRNVLEVLEFGSVWIRTNDQSGKLLKRVFTLSGRKLLDGTSSLLEVLEERILIGR